MTIGPLAGPYKALGLESLIEPWSAQFRARTHRFRASSRIDCKYERQSILVQLCTYVQQTSRAGCNIHFSRAG